MLPTLEELGVGDTVEVSRGAHVAGMLSSDSKSRKVKSKHVSRQSLLCARRIGAKCKNYTDSSRSAEFWL